MHILVTGGRNYESHTHVWRELDKLHALDPVTFLVHGHNPRGVDLFADQWAQMFAHIEPTRVPAEWAKWGQYEAGKKRNQKMLDLYGEQLDLVVAFPGGSGTADMTFRAIRAGLRTLVIGRT